MGHDKSIIFWAAIAIIFAWSTPGITYGGRAKIFGTVQAIRKGVSDHPFLICRWAKSKGEFEAELKVSLASPGIQKVWVPVPY